MLPKLRSAREWAAYLRRMREREQLWARTFAARFTPEERAAMIQEAQRNSRHGFAVSYPAVGIVYNRKSRVR
jgi:hypothetical protein